MTGFYERLKIEYGACPPACSACVEACAKERGNGALMKLVDVGDIGFQNVNTCIQCGQPVCIKVCPTGAIYKSESDGVVRIEGEKCVGCGLCTLECPYGGIYFDASRGRAFKCDTCDGKFKCVEACKYGVLSVIRNRETYAYLNEDDPVTPGDNCCIGCGAELGVRFVLKVLTKLNKEVILFGAPGCAGVVTNAMGTKATTKIPNFFCLMTNIAPIMTGVKRYYRKMGRDVTTVAFVGDGATADVGFQTLSGAAERGENIIYICYDNEAYMATGIQRSGTTPFKAWTFTTPVGQKRRGKEQISKYIPLLMALHGIAYTATANLAYLDDFARKLAKASKVKDGMSYIHLFSPCPTGWRAAPENVVQISRMAVETNYFPLWEAERRKFRLTYEVAQPKPIQEFTRLMDRFSHLRKEELDELQESVNSRFAFIKNLTEIS
jgi:phenylglyoxylate dehydrogenase beta subunit